MIMVALAGPARADRVTVGPVSVEPPAGFALQNGILVADKAMWGFSAPDTTADPDAWMVTTWKTVTAKLTDVRAVPVTKQKLANGFVLYIAAATAGDASGGDHYIMLLGAYRPDSKRMYPSVFDALTSKRFAELSPKVGNAVATFAIVAKAEAAKEASKPAPAKDAPTPEAPKGDTGPDAVMTPEYSSVHTLIVPPPRRVLQQSDMVGEWGLNNGAVAAYANSNGSYAGFGAVSIGEKWLVDGQGALQEDFLAVRTGAYAAPTVKEHNTGTLTIDNRNIIKVSLPAQNGNKASVTYFIVFGWFVGPEAILMRVNGPFYGEITAKNIADFQTGSYMSRTYVKKR
jgi:hypothetical protein